MESLPLGWAEWIKFVPAFYKIRKTKPGGYSMVWRKMSDYKISGFKGTAKAFGNDWQQFQRSLLELCDNVDEATAWKRLGPQVV
jgi:hypothetical protein